MKICSKNFKRVKHREDSSDFDDFRTKRIVVFTTYFEKFSKERNERKDFETFENISKKYGKKFTDHVRIEIISTPSDIHHVQRVLLK